VISNYYTFLLVVSTFNSSLPGKRVREVYSQHADELSIAFQDHLGKLVFLCRPDLSAVYLHEGKTRARRNSVDLLGDIVDRHVNAVTLRQFDRVVEISLDNGVTLAAVLYGPKSNVLLLGDSGTILDSFKNPKKLTGTSFQFTPAAPPGDFQALGTAFATPERRTVVSAIRRSFPAMGGTLALESVARAGLSASLTTDGVDSEALVALERGVGSVLTDLERPLSRVYISGEDVPAFFSLIPLTLAGGMKEEQFPDINKGIRFFLARRASKTFLDGERESLLTPLRLRIEKEKRALRAIQTDAQEAERAGTYERFGNALMAALPDMQRGSRTFDDTIEGERVSILLDPALSPVQNAQRYFEKAKRAKSAGEESARRMIEISARIDRLEKLLAGAKDLAPGDKEETFLSQHAEEFESVGLGARSREKERLPFRIFTVEGGFEVWAGKNGANNDLLTLRYAKPDDLWFHARGGSGSHVVLKVSSGKGEPGKKACEQAAAIAAYYSKMKNSGTVAVAMTEKRFVRKPRGAPAGTVMIEREKVLFARPALPPEGKKSTEFLS